MLKYAKKSKMIDDDKKLLLGLPLVLAVKKLMFLGLININVT